MSRFIGKAVYALLGYLLLTGVANADFASCGTSEDELNQFRSNKNYIQLAAAYVNDCATHSQLLGEGQVFLSRIRSADDANRANAVRQTTVFLISRFDEEFGDSNCVNATAKAEMRKGLECTRLSMESVSEEMLGKASCDLYPSEDGTVSIDHWRPIAEQGPVFTEAFVVPFGDCANRMAGSDPDCQKAFEKNFLPILEYQSIMHSQVRPIANQESAEKVVAYYSASHERWKSYLADTGFQYPWELTFNRWKRGGFEEIARREEAPTSRFIVAHPTVAIAYSEASPDGDQMRLMGVLKLVGYKWWKFSSNRAMNVWGISATATLADLLGVSDGGYGVMVEYNQFALGWSSHRGDAVVFVSVDLATFLRNRPDTIDGWLKMLEE
jgi:hypothetical protein